MDFLKAFGGAITPPMITKAVDLVEHAAAEFLNDATRREYVVEGLMRALGVPEHVARLLVELVVFALKHPRTVLDAEMPSSSGQA